MARKKTTVYLDEELLIAAKVLAATSGRREYEVLEDALREYVSGSLRADSRAQLTALLDRVAERSDLDEDEAMSLAYSELRAARKQRAKRALK
jgi:hypothetical protein